MRSFIAAATILLWSCASANAQEMTAAESLAHGNRIAGQGQYETALSIYQVALPTSGDLRPVIEYNIGVCDYHLGRLNEAVPAYKAASRCAAVATSGPNTHSGSRWRTSAMC